MIGFPKPQRRLTDRVTRRRAREAQAQRFRQAVWKRDGGICQSCGRHVRRTVELVPERGEVHHLRGRNVAPADRYNVKAAKLLCLACHQQADVVVTLRRETTA